MPPVSAGSEERVSTEPVGRSFARARVSDRQPVAIRVEPEQPAADECLDFVRFCYGRRRVSWPALYDEMAAVAARGAYRGLGYAELAEHGICFSLSDLPRLAALAEQVMLEERAASGHRPNGHESPAEQHPPTGENSQETRLEHPPARLSMVAARG